MTANVDWVVCQLGAREHYAIPRALQLGGRLNQLLTDAWVPPGSLWGHARKNLGERYHPELGPDQVTAWNAAVVAFELRARLRSWKGWERTLRRNEWFQRQVVTHLGQTSGRHPSTTTDQPVRRVLFSFSYTALEPFRWAKANGWKTVLGQIDGGVGDERKVVSIHRQHGVAAGNTQLAPERYWKQWHEECDLADAIIVNSHWSKQLLVEAGLREDRIEQVPLAYSPPPKAESFERQTPDGFGAKRPLRVLFLGQTSVRKGVIELLQAARQLADEPIEFWMVGPRVAKLPAELVEQENVKWFGAVPRGNTHQFYQDADVFLFPTHSDGFGLTQLEAQAWKLPIIASRHCGEVVEHGANGLILDEVTAGSIVASLRQCLDSENLRRWSKGGSNLEGYSVDGLATTLRRLESRL